MWAYKAREITQSNTARYEVTLDTEITLSSHSKVHKFVKEMLPHGAFRSRNCQIKIFVDRLNWNLLAPKFKIEVHLQKDGAKSVDMTADTTGSPYVFNISGFAKFIGLKIYKTGSGSERKVELNGEDILLVNYSLTDNSCSAKVTLGSDYLEPKITWKGKLPQTTREFETFMLENSLIVDVSGTKGNLDLSLDWKLMNPNLGTPQDAKISLKARGNNPWLGDYSLSREINWMVENRIVEVDWSGLAQFENGWLASLSPIETSFQFKILLVKKDLIGKFMKKIDGKEFSIDFPEGSGVMPKIIMGQ